MKIKNLILSFFIFFISGFFAKEEISLPSETLEQCVSSNIKPENHQKQIALEHANYIVYFILSQYGILDNIQTKSQEIEVTKLLENLVSSLSINEDFIRESKSISKIQTSNLNKIKNFFNKNSLNKIFIKGSFCVLFLGEIFKISNDLKFLDISENKSSYLSSFFSLNYLLLSGLILNKLFNIKKEIDVEESFNKKSYFKLNNFEIFNVAMKEIGPELQKFMEKKNNDNKEKEIE